MPQQVIPIPRESNWKWYAGMIAACLTVYLVVVGIEYWRYRPPQPTYIFIPTEPSPTPKVIATPRHAKANPTPFDPDKDPYLVRKP